MNVIAVPAYAADSQAAALRAMSVACEQALRVVPVNSDARASLIVAQVQLEAMGVARITAHAMDANESHIGETVWRLIKDKRLDANGYCVIDVGDRPFVAPDGDFEFEVSISRGTYREASVWKCSVVRFWRERIEGKWKRLVEVECEIQG